MKTAEDWTDLLGQGWTTEAIVRAAQAEAVRPFVEAFAEHLAEFDALRKDLGDPLPADDDKAEAIYAWALSMTWGELRQARALLDPVQSADETS